MARNVPFRMLIGNPLPTSGSGAKTDGSRFYITM
jgi:hypothetical protein